ncbi:hypothetical protein ACNKHO_03295 [Shigella flexneri]
MDGSSQDYHGLINPLPHLAVILGETHPQGVGLHHAPSAMAFASNGASTAPFSSGAVRHAPGVWQGRKPLAIQIPGWAATRGRPVHSALPRKK